MNQEEEGAKRLNEREKKILQRAEPYLSAGDIVDHTHDMLSFTWNSIRAQNS